MDDLTSKISQILSDPEAMEQIKGLAGLLGTENAELSDSEENTADEKPEKEDPPSLMGGDMINIFMKIMPLLNDLNKEDDSTRLLKAIKPFLSPQRQKKVDEALNILKIIKFLPLLKDGLGLFS